MATFATLLREQYEKTPDRISTTMLFSGQPDEAHGPCEPDLDSYGGFKRAPKDVALLQHSSGTTGLQKGVALSHQAIINHLNNYAVAIKLTQEDILVSCT